MNTSYRQIHENFMQNHNGTTIWENILIITPAPFLVYFVCLFNFYILQVNWSDRRKQIVLFIVEFISIVTFIIFSVTILADYIHILLALFSIPYILTLKYYSKNASKPFFYIARKGIVPRPYITYFRSVISIITCICILAVDFQIFPRRLAKTETFGYGLMDTGVGFYIVANGVVFKQNNKRGVLVQSLLSSIPVLLLGIIRYISLETLDYQRHATEYGVHWNFFFTLAIVKLTSSILMYKFPNQVVFMAILMALLHQIMLFCGAENWVLSEIPRKNFFTANREGLISLTGYISLYMSSVAIGKFLNMPSVRLIDDVRHGINAFIWSLIMLCCTLTFHLTFGVSRRLANLTYITWILAMSLYGISFSIFTEVNLRLSLRITNKNQELLTPTILQAVNYNSLLFFLLSNLLTGIINLMFQTIYVGLLLSIVLLMLYKLCSCGIMYMLYLNKIKLKFW